ncbi:MAG: hypothetical protein RLZZ174_1530 [Pseudomonadota bacterium]|jgi:hypothetical protein
MVASMAPRLDEGCFVFCPAEGWPGADASVLGAFREEEGVTLIQRLAPGTAPPPGSLAMAKITLQVYSDLEGVGLTAAVASALAAEGIPCNVVAAVHHDHLFVPASQGSAALACLQTLSRAAREAS